MSDFARAEILVALRKARHLSREKVASEIDVSTKSVYAWENGGGIRWDNAKKLGLLYDVDPETLVTCDGGPAVVALPNPDASPLDADEAALRRIESKLDALLEHFAVSDPAAELEALLGEDDPPSASTGVGSDEDAPARKATGH